VLAEGMGGNQGKDMRDEIERPREQVGKDRGERGTHCIDHIGNTASNQYYFP
jgi:hypothetical protein